MCYRCEALGQSNQAHQLQLLQKVTLMKNCDFCVEKNERLYNGFKYCGQNVNGNDRNKVLPENIVVQVFLSLCEPYQTLGALTQLFRIATVIAACEPH